MNTINQDYEWVKKNIISCSNTFHVECIDIIIYLFFKKHNEVNNYNALVEMRNTKATQLQII